MAESSPIDVAGLILTGGSSRRMGFDKTQLSIEGIPLARRVASALIGAADPVLEVGPGVTRLPTVSESPKGEGPLVAVVCGARELRRRGHRGAVLVVASDLPFLRREGLFELARWPVDGSVVPVVQGRAQPLCARWSIEDLEAGDALVERGERTMRALVAEVHPLLLDVASEMMVLSADQLVDLDTRRDVQRLHDAAGFPGPGESDHSSVRSLR
ncbi:MAG: molybdenum cofactor guanylyltransferase [Acidimicrobiales bacterium]